MKPDKLSKEEVFRLALSVYVVGFQEFRLEEKRLGIDGTFLLQRLMYECLNVRLSNPTAEGFYYHSRSRFLKELGIGRTRLDTITNFLEEIKVLTKKSGGYLNNIQYRIEFENMTDSNVLKALYRVPNKRLLELAKQYAQLLVILNPGSSRPLLF